MHRCFLPTLSSLSLSHTLHQLSFLFSSFSCSRQAKSIPTSPRDAPAAVIPPRPLLPSLPLPRVPWWCSPSPPCGGWLTGWWRWGLQGRGAAVCSGSVGSQICRPASQGPLLASTVVRRSILSCCALRLLARPLRLPSIAAATGRRGRQRRPTTKLVAEQGQGCSPPVGLSFARSRPFPSLEGQFLSASSQFLPHLSGFRLVP